ncbi:tectonic-2 [Elysia marginata]|uniref:Tectonic-2 n=1 Tax=Elysia marginata TaxID=1093978 RepID=A0AAV4JN96_9GAST|nr:tectonic-2 [Elysia marginata]
MKTVHKKNGRCMMTNIVVRTGVSQDIPIFAAVFANGNPATTVAKTEDITISCSVLDNGTGFTILSITDVTLPAADDSGSIPLVSVKVLPPATVTQCKLASSVISGTSTFAVQLSITSQRRYFKDSQVSFTVTNGSLGQSAQVTCTAQSASGAQYTTAGSQVEASSAVFTWRPFSLTFEPANVRVYNTTVTSFLVLSDPNSVDVACRAYTVSSLQAAQQAATPNCVEIESQSSAETTPWRVKTAFFKMTADTGAAADISYFKPVITSRVQPVSQAVSEVVLTRCCVTSNSADIQFRGLHATMITVAQLAPFVCENCNTTVENAKTERILQNPGYVEVAPCPCDLTGNACDFNCCCDKECSVNQKARFSECIPGLPGGEPAEPEEYRCSSNAFNLPDWHLMTCVFYESNAYLGMYYMNKAQITETAFTEVVSKQYKGRFSLSKPEPVFESQSTAYSYGVSVTTLREDIAVGPRSTGILALPHLNSEGACNFLSPVRFLVDQQASCTSTLLPETCSSLSRFSGRIYAASSDITGCSQSFKVTSTLSGSSVAPTDVRYYCAPDPSPYLTTTDNALSLNELPQNQVSQFGSDLANENCTLPCSSQTCLNYNRGKEPTVNQALPNLCSWDDGSTSSRVPVLNSGVCSNVVLDVRYKFEWSGSQITGLTASVILGDVSNVQGSGVSLTQKFAVEWVHKTNGSVYSLSDNFDSTTEAYERSGTAGYNDGAPMFSGCYNETTLGFQRVATNFERQMAVWRPGVDGLCENATRQTLTFADDTFSSCALRLTVNELDSGCDDLR